MIKSYFFYFRVSYSRDSTNYEIISWGERWEDGGASGDKIRADRGLSKFHYDRAERVRTRDEVSRSAQGMWKANEGIPKEKHPGFASNAGVFPSAALCVLIPNRTYF